MAYSFFYSTGSPPAISLAMDANNCILTRYKWAALSFLLIETKPYYDNEALRLGDAASNKAYYHSGRRALSTTTVAVIMVNHY
jgi:hypothetical protein